MIAILYLVLGFAAAYQLAALCAVLAHLRKRKPVVKHAPSVSILKPMHGIDPCFEEALASHACIEYPDYELLFGVNREDDPAVAPIRRFTAAHAGRRIGLHPSRVQAPNGKVASLIELARHAKGEIWVVNDGDISVPPDYLRRLVAELSEPGACLVTCLYRPKPRGLPAFWEALGISCDFAPSTLVAPWVGVREFGLGSTLCFRAEDLKRAGGFEPLASVLADDYQLARRIVQSSGKRAVMSTLVVDTHLEYSGWRALWRHQVRWARTIRVSRQDGYLGLPVTHAGVWIAAALMSGLWKAAAALLLVRLATACVASAILLRAPVALGFLLAPLWDVFAFAVWCAGLGGSTIEWRGRRMHLSRDGRLLAAENARPPAAI